MAVPKSHVFAKGRPSIANQSVTNPLRYIPRARTPWNPSSFQRENIVPDDLKTFWDMGRGRTGPAFQDSGYFTGKSHNYEENAVNIIPKAELEKYMPDINLGPKALVTPVSMMNVRAGHRVTHDMIHSYDPFIGKNDKLAVVDHDNITPQDPNRVGLHPATIHCRGRIYRWLRRGPFFQEDHYFRRNIAPNGDHESAVSPEDVRLAKKVIRIANKGHLKAAAEEYRKFVSVPPVQVYRALTAACVGQGRIADAVAIFEDGDSKLFYVSRDAEVLTNVMKAAINARNRSRVLWVYNIARGRFYENHLVRAEIDSLNLFELSRLALEFFVDNACVEEARAVYDFMRGEESIHQLMHTVDHAPQMFATSEAKSMTEYDLYKAVGLRLREALSKGEAIPAYSSSLGAELAVSKNVAPTATVVVKVLAALEAGGGSAAASGSRNAIRPDEGALQYLKRRYADVDVSFVLRQARSTHGGKVDLLAPPKGAAAAGSANPTDAQLRAFGERAVHWLTVLSRHNSKCTDDVPMPYLRKSKASAINPNVRVAFTEEAARRTRLTASEAGYGFHYGPHNRYVTESYTQPGATLASQLLAQKPVHTPTSAIADFSKAPLLLAKQQKRQNANGRMLAAATGSNSNRISADGRPTAARLLGYDPAALRARRAQAPSVHPTIATFILSREGTIRAAAATAGNGGIDTAFTAVSSSSNRGVDAAAAAAAVRVVSPGEDIV